MDWADYRWNELLWDIQGKASRLRKEQREARYVESLSEPEKILYFYQKKHCDKIGQKLRDNMYTAVGCLFTFTIFLIITAAIITFCKSQ
jgi:hypothetical protein